MTFVAQPYEQFVDDLLTSLTGGSVREEHRYLGTDPERLYHLGKPNAEPESIRIVGQRNESFLRFERGIDFRYLGEEEAIVWIDGGREPDDHSYFYVNFDRRDAPRQLTDRNIGSVTATFAEAFSRQYAVIHQQMRLIYESAFVGLSTGKALGHVAALLGLERRDERFSVGEVLFTRQTPAPGDINIPAGTQVSTDQGVVLATTERRVLRRGQLSLAVPIRAVVEGLGGRVEAQSISIVNRPLFGIDAVLNERPTFFARERETDSEFRQRIVGTLERAGKATLGAIKFSLIEALPEINEANIQVEERSEQTGIVDIRLGVSDYDVEFVRRVEETIFNARPAGVSVRHNLSPVLPSEQVPRTAANLLSAPGGDAPELATLDPSELGDAPAGLLPLGVEVVLRLENAALSVSQKERLQDELRDRVKAYIDALPMDQDVIYNKLIAKILEPDEILDATLSLQPRGSTSVARGENIPTLDRKATIEIGDIDVRLVREQVFVDLRVLVEPKPSEPNARVTDAVRDAVKAAIDDRLSQGGSTVAHADLQRAIESALEAAGSNLIFAEDRPVVFNAEYEETGQIVNDAQEIALAPYQQATLRDFTIDIPDDLDG